MTHQFLGSNGTPFRSLGRQPSFAISTCTPAGVEWSAVAKKPSFKAYRARTFGSVFAENIALVCRDERYLTSLYEIHLKASLANAPLEELLATDVDNVISGIPRSVSTRNRCRKLVHDTLDFAVRAGYCVENVARKPRPWGATLPDSSRFAHRFGTALAILHQEDPDAATLMAIAASSEVPLDRLLTLYWHAIDYEAQRLRCDGCEDEADKEEPAYGPSLGSNATYVLACRYLRDEFGWGLHVFPAKESGKVMKMPFGAIKRAMLKAGLPDDFSIYSLEGLHRSEAIQTAVDTFARTNNAQMPSRSS